MTWIRARGHTLIWLVLLLTLAALVFQERDDYLPQHHALPKLVRGGYVQVAPVGYVPPGSIFGFQAYWFVSSRYDTEPAVLQYRQGIIGDYDYGTGSGLSLPIKLPGHAWDRYAYLGTSYVYGSGYIQLWKAPNGGVFAYLHMRGAPGGPQHNIPGYCGASSPRLGFDATGLALGALPPAQSLPQLATYRGGQVVGYSGWPWCWAYSGGGPPGPGDAHLCLVTGVRAVSWFYAVAHNLDKKPAVFPLKDWRAYTSGHRLKPINPRYQGKLKMSARWWWKHHLKKTLHGVASKDKAYSVSKTNKHAYTMTQFAKGTLTCWSDYRKCKALRR